MNLKDSLKFDLLNEIKDASAIAISGHIRPDGDCVGAVMATYLYLKKVLSEASVQVYLEQPADIFADIAGIDSICTTIESAEVPDVFIVLDCTKDRLGFAEELFDKAEKTINIDHHISNKGSADVNFIVPDASAASEIVYELIEKEKMDIEIAKALYIGIIHDTGVLQYSNTSPKTMRIAADLMEYGFDFSDMIQRTFYERTYIQTQILGRALLESFRFMDGRCVVCSVSKKDMSFYGVGSKDLDGIVNHLNNIKGVDCAIFMYETGVLEYKVSMRSKGKVDVSKIAVVFGGGGHARAAGCTLNGTMHDVINNLSLHIEKQFFQEKEAVDCQNAQCEEL